MDNAIDDDVDTENFFPSVKPLQTISGKVTAAIQNLFRNSTSAPLHPFKSIIFDLLRDEAAEGVIINF